jgi:hypothetical protein
MQEVWGRFTSWLSTAWDSIKSTVNAVFGRHSPSTWFADLGSDLMAGLQGGINNAANLPLQAITSLASSVKTKTDSMVSTVANSAAAITNSIRNMPALPAGYWSTPDIPVPVAAVKPVSTNVNTNIGGPLPAAPVHTVATVAPIIPVFDMENIAEALFSSGGREGKIDTFNDIMLFASKVKEALTAGGEMLQFGSAEHQASSTLGRGALDFTTVADVLSMLQTLIRKIDEKGLGSNFSIQLAPDAALGQTDELQGMVTYLNALYG